MHEDLLRGHLDGLLLAVLADRPGHGYGLSQRLAARSGGSLTVPEGSLYPAMQRLEGHGLVSSSWTVVEGRRRRVYQLTSAGRTAASRRAQDWRSFARAVDTVIGDLA